MFWFYLYLFVWSNYAESHENQMIFTSIYVFPFDLQAGTSTIASKFEELEALYAGVGKIIYEGLTGYEK